VAKTAAEKGKAAGTEVKTRTGSAAKALKERAKR
jgi:hypothetical protein